MKILYIVPTIHDEGGVAKVLSVKTTELLHNNTIQIGILTFNNFTSDTFHPFSEKIERVDIKASGWKLFKILDYYKKVSVFLKKWKPDIIVICDFGWKGFFFSKFIKTDIPLVFEIHGSLYNETKKLGNNLFVKLRATIRKKLLTSYKNIVYLSQESKQEWEIPGEVIPNPVPKSNVTTTLQNHKAITIARHSYEKGIDRLINIWNKVSQQSDWELEIYGDGYLWDAHQRQIEALRLNNKIHLCKPIQNIHQKYAEASLLLMTSRSEGYPMALLEAMEVGLPVIAYDCPIGPKSIIENNISGFLIEDGNESAFISKVLEIQNSFQTRERIGQSAKQQVQKLYPENIGILWETYFKNLLSNV